MEGGNGGEYEVDPCKPPEEHAQGKITVVKACADHDGKVTITLSTVGGYDEVEFIVEGTTYKVEPGYSIDVVIGGLTDGTHHISVQAGYQDLSFDVEIACDLPPRVSVTKECKAFDGSVSILLENLGDDTDATFTVDGVDHIVTPGGSTTVVIDGLPDGVNAIPLAINGVPQPDLTVLIKCNPVIDVVAECNTVSNLGEIDSYWFTVTNTEATDIEIVWEGGSTIVAGGTTVRIQSATSALTIKQKNGEVIKAAPSSNVVCRRDVVVEKLLIGAPVTPETYTVMVSRWVNGAYVPELSFQVQPGSPVTVQLPSTLDPAGIQYRIDETNKGTAEDSVVTPDQFLLTGHLGDVLRVSVTNRFAPPPTTTTVVVTTTTTPVAETTTTTPVVEPTTTTTPVGETTTTTTPVGPTVPPTTEPPVGPTVPPTTVPPTTVPPTTEPPVGPTVPPTTVPPTVPPTTTIVDTGGPTTTTDPGASTTTDPGASTTTDPGASTTTTIVDVGGPTTTSTPCCDPVPTTIPPTSVLVEPPAPPITDPLPSTGGSNPLPLMLIAFGIACIGGSMVLVRRRA